MLLSIRTNITAIAAQRNLSSLMGSFDSSLKRLSSGLRINSAADDAAGLQISNRLTSEINGSNGAIRNINDAISVINVADGAMDESMNLMQRMRTLALQAGSGINSTDDRAALNMEFQQMRLEMDRIATKTTFAGQSLLAGTYEGVFSIGAYAGQNMVITDMNAQTKNLGEMVWQSRSPTSSKPGAHSIDGLGFSVSGSYNNNPANNQLTIHSSQGNSLTLANGSIHPPQPPQPAPPAPPIPPISANPSLSALLTDVSSTTYIGQLELSSSGTRYSNIDMEGNTLGSLGFFLQDKQKYTVDNIDVLSESNASRAIRTLDAGMKQLGVQRSQIGAQANSLEARGRSLSTSHENLSAARARIRDADIASESARMVRVQIMQQASASILSQANSRPKLALSLLQ